MTPSPNQKMAKWTNCVGYVVDLEQILLRATLKGHAEIFIYTHSTSEYAKWRAETIYAELTIAG